MFGLYFGDYLLQRGLVTKQDLDDVIFEPYLLFVEKLVEKKCFGADEAEELILSFHESAKLSDKQMEALKRGDLEDIISAFVDFNSAEAIDKNYKAYQNDNNLSDEEMEKLKADGVDELLLPRFVIEDPKYYNRYISVVLNYLVDFISKKIIIKPIHRIREYEFEFLAYQELKGAQHIYMAFCGRGNSLLAIANRFGHRKFTEMNDDVFNTVCELINCLNGLFASEVSYEDLYLEIALPGYYSNKKLVSNGLLYRIPVVVDNEEIDLIISLDSDVKII